MHSKAVDGFRMPLPRIKPEAGLRRPTPSGRTYMARVPCTGPSGCHGMSLTSDCEGQEGRQESYAHGAEAQEGVAEAQERVP